MATLDDYEIPVINKNEQRKKLQIPISDMDDLAFKNRQDPQFIAQITNMMQVPQSISLKNDPPNRLKHSNPFAAINPFSMEIPDKLTANENINDRDDNLSHEDNVNEDLHNVTATPPTTPTKEMNETDAQLKTPKISSELTKKIRMRRSSIEIDLQEEIRMLRDKINYLENECQINSRSCRFFYAILCGYVLIKTFSWLASK